METVIPVNNFKSLPTKLSTNKIIYTFIGRANDNTVLCEYSHMNGNFRLATQQVIQKLPKTGLTQIDAKDGDFEYHFLIQQGMMFGCLCSCDFSREIALAMLFDIATTFWLKYQPLKDQLPSAPALSLSSFTDVLIRQMDYYSSNPSMDRINRVKAETQELQKQLQLNVEQLLGRQEHINIVLDKVQILANDTERFRKNTVQLRKKLQWQNLKYVIFVAIVVIMILYLFTTIF